MARRMRNNIRNFLDNESAGGLLLIAAAILALVTANSPLSDTYFTTLHAYLGPLSLHHWINDALMAVFFLMVGLEIKREMADGHLSSWPRRILPGAAAAAGIAVPALVYLAFNLESEASHGWAIPAATVIAFAPGVISLVGPRVPTSLEVFPAALYQLAAILGQTHANTIRHRTLRLGDTWRLDKCVISIKGEHYILLQVVEQDIDNSIALTTVFLHSLLRELVLSDVP